jgi:soluble lytic murein transglycosylase-like protein
LSVARVAAIAAIGSGLSACGTIDNFNLRRLPELSDQAYVAAVDILRQAYAAAAEACLASLPPERAKPGPVGAADPRLMPLIAEASTRFAVPEPWIHAVIRVESDGDGAALSPKGAMGLMQVMPDTYAELRGRHGLGDDPYQPRDNILAGSAFIRELYDRYGAPGFIAAYNAGPARYDDYVTWGRALPDETVRYVAAVRAALDKESERQLFAGAPVGWPAITGPRDPIGVLPSGELVAQDTGGPVSVKDRLALHAQIARALRSTAPTRRHLAVNDGPPGAR